MLRTTDEPLPPSRPRRHDWEVAAAAALLTIAADVCGREFGDVHHNAPEHQIAFAWGAAAAVVVFGAMAIRFLAAAIGRIVAERTVVSAGATVRLVITGIGYVVLVFVFLDSLNISITHLLLGAGLAGVILGIAAQQSLGNVFAGIVLLLARPFTTGEAIRIRSGALGGIFDGVVLGISLTYVTVRTEDGVFKIPNSALLAAAVGAPIGPLPSRPGTPAPPAEPQRGS